MVNHEKGFSLLEVVVAIAILAIIGGGIMPLFGKLEQGAKTIKVKEELKNIQIAADEYFYDKASYPASLSDSAFLGVYLNTEIITASTDDAIRDDFKPGSEYDYCQGLVVGYPVPKYITSVGPNGSSEIDECGIFVVGADDLYIVLNSSIPGNRRTRLKINIIARAYAKYLYSTALATMTTTWTGAGGGREDLSLGIEFVSDGFGVNFLGPNSTTYTFYSTGASQTVNSGCTTASIGTGDDLKP